MKKIKITVKKNNMCDGRRYVTVSIKADVYDKLYQLSKQIVPGTQLSIPKIIEIITKQQQEKLIIKKL
jgi:hypothetical protein